MFTCNNNKLNFRITFVNRENIEVLGSFTLSVLALLGHLSQRERQGSWLSLLGSPFGRAVTEGD